MEKESFAPGILMPDGSMYYPTGVEWLMAFALAGYKWAEEMLPAAIENWKKEIAREAIEELKEAEKNLGAYI